MTARNWFVAQGRLPELKAWPDAELLAYTVPKGVFGDYRITRYKSRSALLAFCKDGSAHHAVIKDSVPANMLVNRNTQRSQVTP